MNLSIQDYIYQLQHLNFWYAMDIHFWQRNLYFFLSLTANPFLGRLQCNNTGEVKTESCPNQSPLPNQMHYTSGFTLIATCFSVVQFPNLPPPEEEKSLHQSILTGSKALCRPFSRWEHGPATMNTHIYSQPSKYSFLCRNDSSYRL